MKRDAENLALSTVWKHKKGGEDPGAYVAKDREEPDQTNAKATSIATD